MATRLVGDELDFDLAALSATLFVVIIVAGSGWTSAFDAAGRIAGRAVAGMIIELGGGGLVVLIGDVGHFVLYGITKSLKGQVGGDTALSVVPMTYAESGGRLCSVVGDCRRNPVGAALNRVWCAREREASGRFLFALSDNGMVQVIC